MAMCWLALRQTVLHSRAVRSAAREHEAQLEGSTAERVELVERLAAAETTAHAAVTAAAAGQEAARAAAEAADAERMRLTLAAETVSAGLVHELAEARASAEATQRGLQAELDAARADASTKASEISLLGATVNAFKRQAEELAEQPLLRQLLC